MRPSDFNELTSSQNLKNYATNIIPYFSLQYAKIIFVFLQMEMKREIPSAFCEMSM